MENQTRYDLNTAIENWCGELARQTGFAADARHELETHLRDAITDFQQRGLTDEESFWLARRRIGPIPQLHQEFIQADCAGIWRERFYWMALALVGSYVFMTWKDLLATWMHQSNWIECLYLVPVLLLTGSVVMLRNKKFHTVLNGLETITSASFKSTAAMFLILLATVLSAYFRGRNLPTDGDGISSLITMGYNIGLVLSWLANAIWPFVIVLILLLTHRRPKTSRRVDSAA